MREFLQHQADLWRMGVWWRLLWLTVRYPRRKKYLMVMNGGHAVVLGDA